MHAGTSTTADLVFSDHVTPTESCCSTVFHGADTLTPPHDVDCAIPRFVFVAGSTPSPSSSFDSPEIAKTKPASGRASRACLGCRSRKVRCDVTRRSPCGNCEWRGWACIVKYRRKPRGRSYQRRNTRSVQGDISSLQCEPLASEECLEGELFQQLGDLDYTSLSSQSTIKHNHDPSPNTAGEQSYSFNQVGSYWTFPSISTRLSLPSFIKPLRQDIDSNDLDFLRSKGALSIPVQSLQSALVRAYVHHIHPHLPVLDLNEFLESITAKDESTPRVSLLIYQAILASGTACVKIRHLNKAGFQTRKNARKILLDRVRLLYDFNCELDRSVLIQVSLLMSLAYEEPSSHRSNSYWLDAAISHAFAAKFHYDPSLIAISMPAELQKLRRRLWWCCYSLDHLVSLGTSRIPRIVEDDFHVSALELSDFHPLRHNFKSFKSHSDYCLCAGKEETHRELAILFIQQTNLCRVLSTAARLFKCSPWSERDSIWASGESANNGRQVFSFERRLAEWYDALPCQARYRDVARFELGREGQAAAAVSRSFLHLAFNMVMLNVYQSRFEAAQRSTSGALYEMEHWDILMSYSAGRISDVAANIEARGLSIFLHPAAIHFAIAASEIHQVERPYKTQEIAESKHDQCAQLIDSMQEAYSIPQQGPTFSSTCNHQGTCYHHGNRGEKS